MSPLTLPSLLLPLLSLHLQTTHSVTITLDANLDAATTQTCHDIPPGECCAAITLPRYCYYNPFNPTSARFDNLHFTDIAAVWGPTRDDGADRACSGVPLATRGGVVGTWDFPAPDERRERQDVVGGGGDAGVGVGWGEVVFETGGGGGGGAWG
ncbi:MAG: hypothetical protein Q9195_000850 [Heterodermia aff. obscurata]